ncbi:hypothetical protein [Polyangium fumosum]|uniref:Uncharacterized protein n=1 Tax=Polyangium fumosum TaxID=889272 RepID=A0A4U1IWB9_9BACT|nr:hypothetical protein [Polyangium fumosum]TKC98452.1 hypothetical protein E8A74_41275 [Polyangium fumosum]
MSSKSEKPQIHLGIKAKGDIAFFVESATANLGDVPGSVGEYRAKTRSLPVPEELVARFVDIRVRVRTMGGNAQLTLYAHSSALKNDPETKDIDERWRIIATKIVGTTPTVLEGSFDPLELKD